jgi:TonB family protein
MKYLILLLTIGLCGEVFAQQAPPATTQAPLSSQEAPPSTPPPSSAIGSAPSEIGTATFNTPFDPVTFSRYLLADVRSKDIPTLQQRAATGDRTSALELGYAYWIGGVVPRDVNAAKDWLTKAAEQGSGTAAVLLGMIDGGGGGLAPNYEEAEKWLVIAQNAGISVKEMLDKLRQLAGNEKTAQGDRLASAWLAQHTPVDDRKRGGVYKVGGNVKAPKAVYTPDPAFPDLERGKGDATVILWLVIDERGNPRDIKVSRSAGASFDENAIAAVRRWRFKPALKDGRPVAVQVNIEINYRQ